MTSAQIESALKFKRDLERDFETAAGLDGRAFYSAFYSLPQPSPVMWINLNPGGTADDHQILSDEQLVLGLHEFWDGYGKTSRATGAFLQDIFRVPLDRLRSIQGTNVAWERSRQGRDINLRLAARQAAPFLVRYIQYSRSEVIIFGGSTSFDIFVEVHRARILKTSEVLMGKWGTNQARVFVAVTMDVANLGVVKAITVSHPSRGVRSGVLERCRAHLASVELPAALI